MFLAPLFSDDPSKQKRRRTQNTQSSTLPSLRRPLVGHAARICESLLLRRAMTLAQIQALHLPVTGDAALEPAHVAKALKSKLETTRQLMEKLVAHQLVQCTRVGPILLYGGVRARGVVDVAAYYARLFQRQYGEQVPADVAWKADAQTLAAGYEWSPYDKIMAWKDESNLKHHIRDMDANVQLTLACARGGVTQDLWLPEHIIKRLHKGVIVDYIGPDGKAYQSQLRPDDWYIFSKKVGQEIRQEKLLLEVDNGPQTQTNRTTKNLQKMKRSWAHKFRWYHNFFAHKHFKHVYGYDNAKVLILTNSEQRMWHLKQVCEESGGRGRYWFTHTQIFTAETIFEQAIYVRAGDAPGQSVSLFTHDSKSAGHGG